MAKISPEPRLSAISITIPLVYVFVMGGEIIGGVLFIIIGAVLIKWVLSKKSIENAKQHINKTENSIGENCCDSHDADTEKKSMHPGAHAHHQHQMNTDSSSRLKDAAGYFFMDVSMVGKDILIGIIISALLSLVVPVHFWEALFLKNSTHLPQFAIIIWNAVIGIIVAIFAFVCSVGNIFLAAVLWHAGINFGGVIAFILSDLISIPMLMVYRRYYGIKMMWHLFLILSLSILLTALSVDYIFQWTGWIPQQHTGETNMQIEAIKWNCKTILNLIFIPVSLLLFFWGKRSMKKSM